MSDSEDFEASFSDASVGSDDYVDEPVKKSTKKSKTPLSDTTNTSITPTPPSKKKNSKNGNASDQYQKLSQLEHILKRPDTYIGSVERTAIEMWCFDLENESMVFKEVRIVPGLYKIFDEILVNAADNKIRDPSMKNIKVKIDAENNIILVMNDGRGIPVEIHDKEKIYIPELIFGNLLTSSNYDDDEKKVTGGRNGYGAKLCNIFSTQFELETADLNTESLYKQIWTNNMATVSKPKITKMKSKREYTKVTFKPDLSKFGMESLDDDILSVLRRRVYDLCGTVRDCNIYLNDKKLSIRNFKSYVEMYVKAIREKSPEPDMDENGEPKNYTTIVHEVFNSRWEVAFAVSDGSFNQVSFVNSIATTSGGTHIKFVSDQIITKLIEELTKGRKKLMIKPQEVRNNMFLFVNCLIENPAFTSQTKEQLTTRAAQFGGGASEKLVIGESFIKKILKTSIVDKIRQISSANEDKALLKADGSKKNRIKGMVKLEDANKAGTSQGHKCTLILTEGDSALSMAKAGLAVVGRDYYGCFPLRGKLLNVREASADQISKNSEINNIKKIVGLQHKKKYNAENVKSLRYGHIMIMTDQDHDGSHIKGLIINFLETSFPGLLEIPGFLLEFITPIVKVTITRQGGGKRIIPFYSMPEFERWQETDGVNCRWTLKYYKGLGTSVAAEMIEYFKSLDKHLKTFHALQNDDLQYIDLAFSKKKADDRKDWLQAFVPGTHLDSDIQEIPISDFINKELILFSMADNIRSIPSVLDGFKPAQRKVLFGCFKKNLKGEIKVLQLTGYISEQAQYHHGDQSLMQTIIGLAQDFVGSNNLNLLKPNGNFGSRAAGGKDFAAARYIFTELNEITRTVFNPLDGPLYEYLEEDGQSVEPQWYLPIIPMILVNGAEGIGTGWSTNIPSFNPVDIVANLKKLMDNEELDEMKPWYRGWEGTVEKAGEDKYKIIGKIDQIDNNTLLISEIPVKFWTNNMKEFLLNGLGTDKVSPWIKDVEEQHKLNIRFIVKLSDVEMEKSLKMGLLERFKLISSVSLTNMVAFDPLGRIKRYSNVNEILKDYYFVRLEFYQKRKDFMTDQLQTQLIKLSEQARFVKLIIDKKLSISNKPKKVLFKLLEENNFEKFNKANKIIKKQVKDELDDQVPELDPDEESDEGETEHVPENVFSYYDYLLGMALWSLTKERYEKLLAQRENLENELNELLGKSAKDLWKADLDVFLNQWNKFLDNDFEKRTSLIAGDKGNAKKSKRKVKNDDDEDWGPAKKKAVNKKITTKPNTTKSKAPSQRSKTPDTKQTAAKQQPIIKKEDSEVSKPSSTKTVSKQPDLLSFFASSSSTPTTSAKTTKKPSKTKSMFDSDDDEIEIYEILDNAIKPNPTKVYSKKSKSQTKLDDEIADLEIDMPEYNPKSRRSKKSNYTFISSSEDEDVIENEVDEGSDGDFEDD